MNIFAKAIFALAMLVGGAAISAGPASAAPPAPKAPAATGLVEKAAWGCGPGWRSNRWGRCVPIYRPIYRYSWDRPHYYGQRRYYGHRRYSYRRPVYRRHQSHRNYRRHWNRHQSRSWVRRGYYYPDRW